MADSNGPELQAGADGGELPAPKITFREIAVSEDFVISSEALRDNKKTILRTAGDATIILRQGDKNVSIFDLQGTKVDLPGNLSIADWEKVRGDNRLGSSNYKIVATRSDIPSGATDYIMVDKLPDNLRSAVTARLNASATNELELPLDTWQIDTADLSRVAVDVASDSITLYQPGTDNLIAFQRTNDAGTQLPVRNWARVDILTGLSQSVPQSVFERNNYTGQEGVQNIITTTNARTVIVSEEGFRVKRTGDNPSEPDLIIENLPNINNNICEDPSRANEGVIYYCSENPQAIFKLDTRAASPIPVGIPIPGSQEFHGIRNLCMDPSGNFITFSSNEGFFILDKETLEERGRIEHFVQGAIDDQGRIHGINRDGKLVIYEGNFSQFVANIEQRKAEIKMQQSAKQARGEIPTDRQSELEQVYAPYVSARDQNVSSLEAVLERVEDLDQIRAERMALERQLNILRNDGTIPAEAINELFQPALEAVIAEKEREIAQKLVTQDIRTLQGLIQGEWSTDTITQGDSIKGSINALLGILEGNAELLQQIGNIQEQFDTATTTFRREVNEHITTNTQAIISRAQEMIQAIGSKSALARWEDSSIYSGLMSDLGNLKFQAIPENMGVIDNALRQIRKAIKSHREALIEHEVVTGTTATDIRDAKIAAFEDRIDGVIATMNDLGLSDRSQITQFTDTSSVFTNLKDEIRGLESTDYDAFVQLRRKLGVTLSLHVAEIERSAQSTASGDNRPMVFFGDESFPRWEDHEAQRRKMRTKIELDFVIDQSIQPQFRNGKYSNFGEIGIELKNGKPATVKRRLYEGREDEENWRQGLVLYRGGEEMPGTTLVSKDEFLQIKKNFIDWEKGEESPELREELRVEASFEARKERRRRAGFSMIRGELSDRQEAFQNQYLQRPVALPDGRTVTLQEAKELLKQMRDRGEEPQRLTVATKTGTQQKFYRFIEGPEEIAWRDRYEELLQEYGQFAAEKRVSIFHRIEQLRSAPQTEVENSIGYVPEWMSHWTVDGQTASDLRKMAKLAKKQLDMKKGIINLEGHAGTGKDVLIKMFCHMTNRSYFAFDCSKWTVEEDLSETLTLEKGSVLKIPSAVLQAIRTPGAVLYFNEFNAMPEATQIFLHSLLDEKRSLTLKSSGGVTVKADPSVLFFSSMNPGYPGTFEPQFATRSRMNYLPIAYAPLEDPQRAGKFNVAEALRLAREVESLTEYTYDIDLPHNEFVQIWNNYINGETGNGASPIRDEQLFDLRTILALVQFTDKLRKAFMLKFDKRRDRNALTISQPMTGRELADCAYDLSHLAETEKINPGGSGPLLFARRLIIENYLPKISDTLEREKIEQEMSTWTIAAHP